MYFFCAFAISPYLMMSSFFVFVYFCLIFFHISYLFEVWQLLLDLFLFKHSFLHNLHSLQLSNKLLHRVYLVLKLKFTCIAEDNFIPEIL